MQENHIKWIEDNYSSVFLFIFLTFFDFKFGWLGLPKKVQTTTGAWLIMLSIIAFSFWCKNYSNVKIGFIS